MTVRWKSVPLCERCFIKYDNPIDYDGKRPTLVRHPYQLESSVRKVECCHQCGEHTIVGIYVQREVDEPEPEDQVLEGGAIMHARAHLEGPL